jgi:hypothetical protein
MLEDLVVYPDLEEKGDNLIVSLPTDLLLGLITDRINEWSEPPVFFQVDDDTRRS